MCELIGISATRSSNIDELFLRFSYHSWNNRDGWGFAVYEGRAARLYKEPTNISESGLFKFLVNEGYLKGKLIVGHIRNASIGNVSFENTHPFSMVFMGLNIVLAHNGTLRPIRNNRDYRLTSLKPLGETDSEHLFLYILERLRASDSLSAEGITRGGCELLSEVLDEASRLGKLNMLMSDGFKILGYINTGPMSYIDNSSLSKATFENSMAIDNLSLKLKKRLGDIIFTIVSSYPLFIARWMSIEKDRLFIIENGVLEYI